MAKATYVREGSTINFKATAAVTYGDIIPFANCVGVAAMNIAKDAVGTVSIKGVYALPKSNTVEIKAGDAVFFNKATSVIDKTNTGVAAGIAVEDAATPNTTVLVRLG